MLTLLDEKKCLKILEERLGINTSKTKLVNHSKILNDIYSHFDSIDSFTSFLQDGSFKLQSYQELISSFVIGETFFYRNFDVIDREIIPQLLIKNEDKKQLKIWCAGCSTGEEAYSVAILLREKKFQLEDWDIQLFASDLCSSNIEKAKLGVYTEWSFRTLPKRIKDKYFEKKDDLYYLDNDIKKSVHFRIQNLAELSFPNHLENYYEFDLILCRNVMIYFNIDLIRSMSEHFYNSLNDFGFLVVGSSEPSHQLFSEFKVMVKNEAIVYQKNIETKIANNLKKTEKKRSSFDFALDYYVKKEYEKAKQLAIDNTMDNDLDINSFYLIALIDANQRNFSDVKYYCNKIINIDTNFPYSYYLMGLILKEEKDFKKAEYYFKRSTKLGRNFFHGALELAQLYLLQNMNKELNLLINELQTKIDFYDETEEFGFIDKISIGEVKRSLTELKDRVQIGY